MAVTLDSRIFHHHWLINQPLSQSIRELQQQTNAVIFGFVATQMKFHGMEIDECSHAMQCVKCVRKLLW